MKKIIFSVVGLLMISSFVFAEDERQTTVDRAIGGMEQGSRIQAPGTAPTSAHKTISSSQGTKKAGINSASSVSTTENHGNIYTNTGQTNNAGNSSTVGSENGTSDSSNTQPGEAPTVPTETGGSVEVNTGETGAGQITNPVETTPIEPPSDPVNNPIDIGGGAGETGTGETSTGGGGTGPTEDSNPIVETDVNVNPESGTVEADVTVDTTGELEDRQIFDADLGAQDVTTVDAEVGSASEITGQEVVEGADVTISGQTRQTSGSTQIETPPQETTNPVTTESDSAQETSEPSSNPIVGADVNVNPESGAVEADATVDTSGELEERQIIDADVAVGDTIAAETEVGSATDVTQSDVVESADITPRPAQTAVPMPSDLTAEVDTTGETAGGEADVGIEADVSGVSEGEDVTCDPTDGLLSSAVCADLRL